MILKFRGLLFDIPAKDFQNLQFAMSLVRQGCLTTDQAIIETLKNARLIQSGLTTKKPRESRYGTVNC